MQLLQLRCGLLTLTQNSQGVEPCICFSTPILFHNSEGIFLFFWNRYSQNRTFLPFVESSEQFRTQPMIRQNYALPVEPVRPKLQHLSTVRMLCLFLTIRLQFCDSFHMIISSLFLVCEDIQRSKNLYRMRR